MPATTEQIADAFERHVQRYGYGKASVEGVAAELGISKRTIYQRFGNKAGLYAHVVDRIGESERARLEAEIADDTDYTTKMRHFLTTVVTGMRTHIQETSRSDWMQEFQIASDAMARAYGSIGTRLVTEGAAAGEFVFEDGRLANALIGAMVTHYGTMVRDDPGYNEDDAVVAAIMRMLGAGAPGEEG